MSAVTTRRRYLAEHFSALVRVGFAAVILTTIAIATGETIVNTLLPAYRLVFETLLDDFRLVSMGVGQEGPDRVLRAEVTWRQIAVIAGHVIYPDPRALATASTLATHALQGPIVALLACNAWPVVHYRPAWLQLAMRSLLMAPMLPVLILVDAPMVLAAELWAIVLDAFDSKAVSPLVVWKTFLQGGGRYAIGLAAGVACTQLEQWISAKYSIRTAPRIRSLLD